MTRLSKSRFVAGTQCHKLLWWKVHEPAAVELQPDKVLQDRFDQGRQVGGIARDRFAGGVLIDLPHDAVERRLRETRDALERGAPRSSRRDSSPTTRSSQPMCCNGTRMAFGSSR